MSQQSNQAYWTRRFLTVKAKQLKNTEDYERALQPELNGLFREFQSEFESWYVKYANNEGISKEDATKLLQNIDTKHWEITLKQFEEKAKAGGFDQELNSIYYRSRIARLQSLEKQLQQLAERFASQETNHFRNALTKQYDDTYMRTTYNLQAATANVTSNFAHFNEAQLRIVVSEPWGKDGKDFSKRIWRNYRKEMPSMLMDTVLRGTLLGYSEPKIAQMFHTRFQDVEKNNIHRLVITEMAHVQEEATAKGYEENEIEEYEYMATLESHTCEVCAKLDGQRFKVSEREPGVNYPPIHARCRCTTVPWIEGLPETKERWMRDPKTGKGKLIKNMTFDEWKKLTDIK